MYMDKELMLSEEQAITATAASTNVADLGSSGAGNSDAKIFVDIGTAFNNLTSLNITIQTATDAAFTTPVATEINKTVLLAGLTADTTVIRAKLPYGMNRYVRAYYTVTGTAPTTGTVTCGIVLDYPARDVPTA